MHSLTCETCFRQNHKNHPLKYFQLKIVQRNNANKLITGLIRMIKNDSFKYWHCAIIATNNVTPTIRTHHLCYVRICSRNQDQSTFGIPPRSKSFQTDKLKKLHQAVEEVKTVSH